MKLAVVWLVPALLSQAPSSPPAAVPPRAPLEAPSAADPGVRGEAAAAAQVAPVPETALERTIEPYAGSLAEGLAEVERLSDVQEHDAALAVTDALLAPSSFLRWRARASAEAGWRKTVVETAGPLLDRLGLHALPHEHRAAVEYARGVVLARAGRRPDSETAFAAARELAGPGDLRLDATYNLATSVLFEGEAQRAKIPELQAGQPPRAPPPQPAPIPGASRPPPVSPGPPGSPALEPEDPLALARAAYMRAREHFIERIKSDWRDEDVRANLELVQRRLKELDEIEKQREEQQKQQDQDQKQDQDQQKQKDQGQPDDKKDQGQESGEQEKPDPQSKDQPKPEEKKPEEQDKESPPNEAQPEEELSKEEMMQLLGRLAELEEQARRLQEQMRRAGRVKVKKDW